MSPRGFDHPLYVLPFDHRGSFETGMFGWHGQLNADQTAQIAAAKQVIYDGFKAAIEQGVAKDNAGLLVDEQFGAEILRDASQRGFHTACPAEKSGQEEFDFEYGEDFATHIEAFHPTFSKVLVRYNPEGDAALNRRQTERLRRLSDYLSSARRSLFMFELLVPAEKAQLDRVHGDKAAYDDEIRPGLMVQVIEELQDGGVEPDVWKIEGLDRREDCEKMVAAARRNGRDSCRLHHSWPRRERRESPRMAHHRRIRPRLHWFRRRPHRLLGAALRLARGQIAPRNSRRADRPALSRIRRHF